MIRLIGETAKKSRILHNTEQEWSLNLMQRGDGFSFTPAITPKQKVGVTDEVWCLLVYLSTTDKEGGETERCPSSSPRWRTSRKTSATEQESSPTRSPLPTEGHQGVSVECVLRAWGQPYLVSSPGSSAAFTYLMRFYGFRHCKLYSLSQTSKTFLHLLSLTCQVSLGML